MKKTSVVVTGATGFIGSPLVKQLLLYGYDVHLIIRPTSELSIISDIVNDVKIYIHDGSIASLFQIIESAAPQIVLHVASLFLAQHQPHDIEPLIKSNVIFATQLVEAMIANKVFKLVNTGTVWQHFNNTNHYNPVCLYAATKQAFETILAFYLQTTELKVITLKLSDTYGPGDPRKKLFSLLRNAADEQVTLNMSPGEQLIDLVYIDDVISAFILATERLLENRIENHKIYSVTSGKSIKLKELVNLYMKITGKQISIQWGGRPYRNREVMVPWQGEVLSGWKPRVNLETGIKMMEHIQ